jgi:hypothetical protein
LVHRRGARASAATRGSTQRSPARQRLRPE